MNSSNVKRSLIRLRHLFLICQSGRYLSSKRANFKYESIRLTSIHRNRDAKFFTWSNRAALFFKLEEYTGPVAISVALKIRIEANANLKFEYGEKIICQR